MFETTPEATGKEDRATLFKVTLEDGVLVPPKPNQIYSIDELELLSKQSNKEIASQLWFLMCGVVKTNFENILQSEQDQLPTDRQNKRKKGSPAMTVASRYENYFVQAEKVILNYPDTGHGRIVLSHFYANATTGKAEWHPAFLKRWNELKEKCRRGLQKWLRKTKLLTDKEHKNLDPIVKHWIYVGSYINADIQVGQTTCNTHLNKHWPQEFKSGQSPSGLLQMIRHWHWNEFESERRVYNAVKNWKLKHSDCKNKKGKDSDEYSSDEIEEDEEREKDNDCEQPIPVGCYSHEELQKFEAEMKTKQTFKLSYFPKPWLLWYVYGPPLYNGRSEFLRLEMPHINIIKSQKMLTEEEALIKLGSAHKNARRTGRENLRQKRSSTEDDDEDADEDVTGRIHNFKVIRPTKKILVSDSVNKSCIALREYMDVLKESLEDDPDNSELLEELTESRRQLLILLKEKVTYSRKETEDLKTKTL